MSDYIYGVKYHEVKNTCSSKIQCESTHQAGLTTFN